MRMKQIRELTLALAEPSSFLAVESSAEAVSIESLAAASPATLQAIMLTKMSAAANLKKDIGQLISELVEQLADAKIAELVLRQKEAQRKKGGSR